MITDPKFCVDCCYYGITPDSVWLEHKCSYYLSASLITGRVEPEDALDCADMRGLYPVTVPNYVGSQFEPCGPEAKFFKPKKGGGCNE